MKCFVHLICFLGFLFSANMISQTTINPDNFILGRDALPTNGESVMDTFIFYDQTSGAFRGGYLYGNDWWSPDSLGAISFAFGYDVLASGKYSIALGNNTTASGDRGAIALGNNTTASGEDGATAIGYIAQASGDEGATALGYLTVASGDEGATALGCFTVASGDEGATALGLRTIASGAFGSTSLGSSTTASGGYGATAMGRSNLASGEYGATALGAYNTASGNYGSTALGYFTTSSGNSCTVVGMFNDSIVATGTIVSDLSPIFIVGNGRMDSLSNAFVINKNGKIGFGVDKPFAAINHRNGAKLTLSGIWTDASDISKKYNIEPLQNGLQTLLKLKPVSYNYLSDDSHSIGFVAQELEKILPEVVYGEDGDKSIGYGQITAVLTKAIQELQLIIHEQQLAIKNQQVQIDALVRREVLSN